MSTTENNGENAPQKKPMKALNDVFERPDIKKRINEVLRNNAPQFVTTVLQLVNGSAQLAECEPVSIINGALTAAAMGLEINNNLGYAYLIPYNNTSKGYKEAQFQMGYKGFKRLAQNTNRFLILNETDVRQGEKGSIDRMTGQMQWNWVQDDAERNKLPIVGYLSYFKLNNGFESTFYMTVEQLEEHARKYSKTYSRADSKWKTDKPAMSIKTVCKLNLSKNAPLSIENVSNRHLRLALDADQAIIRDFDGQNASFDYEDNPIQDAEFTEVKPKDKADAAMSETEKAINNAAK